MGDAVYLGGDFGQKRTLAERLKPPKEGRSTIVETLKQTTKENRAGQLDLCILHILITPLSL